MIDSFHGEFRFLSNFYIEPDGTHVEGEYQASKCANFVDRAQFKGIFPGQAKRLGKTVELRPEWDTIKLGYMYILVKRKFQDHKELADKLLATGDDELVEGNYWGDKYWGKCRGEGENNLGEILMLVRHVLLSKAMTA